MATTTNYGWETPDDTDLVKDGALAQRTTASAIDTSLYSITAGKNVGLVPLTTQTFTSSSGIILSNIFSAAYDNYVVDIKLTAVSGTPTLTCQLRTGSTTLSSGYNSNLIYGNNGANGATRATNAFYSFGQSAGDFTHAIISSPFLAQPTTWSATSQQGQYCGYDAGVVGGSTSYESLVVGNTIGGLNTGVVRVYGIRNS